MVVSPLTTSRWREAPPDPYAAAVAEATGALTRAAVPHVLVGGLGSALRGRPRWTDDVDVLVAPKEAKRSLATLGAAGFETDETDPAWIYKAVRDGVTVDLLFALKGGIYLDDDMVERATVENFRGTRITVASAEDLVVMKAVADDEPSRHHWHDALGILARSEIDWSYLVERGCRGARRLLSLLAYAQANDLIVPDWAIVALTDTLYRPEQPR